MNDMKLPEGKTCNDCCHRYRCTVIFGASLTNDECDFSPSRFVAIETVLVPNTSTDTNEQ